MRKEVLEIYFRSKPKQNQKKLMAIPMPDFSDDETPQGNSNSPFLEVEPMRMIKESLSHHELMSLAVACDPDKTFSTSTSNGIAYDFDNPIYHTKTCTLYIARKDNIFYALKTTPMSKILRHEWEMFQQIGSFPTIIKPLNFWQEPNKSYFLQLEYAAGGSITNTVLYFDVDDFWRVLAHISAALHFIHSRGFIHFDVSPSNILQTNGNGGSVVYKLADFGTVLPDQHFDSFLEGAGPYVSPEALKWPNTPFVVSFPTDIWSLGAVLFEIVTHSKMPRDPDGYDAMRNGTYDLSIIPDEFSFIRAMLSVDPSLRPTANDLLQLPHVMEVLATLEMDTMPTNAEVSDPWEVPSSYQEEELKRRQSFDGI
ncbi:TKL family protein kinase [Tritrichomonas foetus]|uniref:TKL family protein kinase n=1 Tax=Tritrichomonas foetus TaxID=1144522 RepID=A0A1J4KF14_9EUKA|nr:TKL family protein kinase [Tritrichomonas foetus]|eukprot:OHT07973.1 TKL family protein kinase [Tritrichomonas foetus]